MKKIILGAALGAACLGLAACGDTDTAENNTAAMTEGDTVLPADEGNGAATTTAASDWPQGARIVEENGVTYRIGADGARTRLDGVRIVTENDVRYRVDTDGTRVRIDERGLDVDLDGPDIPGVDVDIGTNRDGNLDVDVDTKGRDATPNR